MYLSARTSNVPHHSVLIEAKPNDSSPELTAGLLRSTTSQPFFSSRLLIACDGGHGLVSPCPMSRVHRLLGDLLSVRCRCEVRFGCNLVQSAVADTNNNDDGLYDGPSALVVIHPRPPPLEGNDLAFDSWINGQRWKSSLVRSPLADWIGLERVVIYHVYFLMRRSAVRAQRSASELYM